jgi:hypothetical protein
MVAVFVDRENLEVLCIISGIPEDRLALVATRNNVVESAFEFDAGFSGHAAILAGEGENVNFKV